eukprot:TRINITY_DN16815_c0_g1_i1.p1 TRINITY_DN16815_c0_g1~~TRINITY_DN16815_c0_g1_i1.p1  ORF type:complete len:313 (+),score=113.66 TRINITY_DN16815_c0_g1_i1:400-1338(+)
MARAAEGCGDVEADVFYLSESQRGRKDIFYHVNERKKMTQKYRVKMHDARLGLSPCRSLEDHGTALRRRGFTIHPFRSSVHSRLLDIENPSYYRTSGTESEASASARQAYFADCERLVQKLSGAQHCHWISYAVRSGHKNDEGVNYLTQYAQFVHGDYADIVEKVAPQMLQKRGLSGMDPTKYDIAYYNVWQPTCPVVEGYPLALLENSSVDPGELHDIRLGYAIVPGKGGQNKEPPIVIPRYNAAHKWWYYPKMTADEALVFTQFDSRTGSARRTMHTAFFHPDQRPGTKRTSVEVRFVCAFPRVDKAAKM